MGHEHRRRRPTLSDDSSMDQFRRFMESRPLIEQAKGKLMTQHGCTADEAFNMLREASMRDNRKLKEIVTVIVQGSGTTGPAHDAHISARELVADDRDRAADERERAADLRQDMLAVREADVERRTAVVEALLRRALDRDLEAEKRDRRAEARDVVAKRRLPGSADEAAAASEDRGQSAVDRFEAGRDRDSSAGDRLELRMRPSPFPSAAVRPSGSVLGMTEDSRRLALREWEAAELAYREASEPFFDGSGLDLPTTKGEFALTEDGLAELSRLRRAADATQKRFNDIPWK